MDIKALIRQPEYEFLRTSPRLGKRIILLGLSGSYGYGTEREGSDVDLRGVAAPFPSDLLGLTSFEQFEDRATDTVIYSLRKIIDLLLDCNPNTIEILGLEEDSYAICTPLGRELLDNRRLFLSRRAAQSFGHYAAAQLRRLQNALARDGFPQPEKEEHILRSVTYALEDFARRSTEIPGMEARLTVGEALTEGMETEIFLDADFRHYPLRKFCEMGSSLGQVVRDYDKVGKRNMKKDEDHLNKHAMHLVRLFMMGIDILEKEEIRTRRPAGDLAVLRAIRDGEYMQEGQLVPAFYEIVRDYERRFEEAKEKTRLPEWPDREAVGRLVEKINRQVILDEPVEPNGRSE